MNIKHETTQFCNTKSGMYDSFIKEKNYPDKNSCNSDLVFNSQI